MRMTTRLRALVAYIVYEGLWYEYHYDLAGLGYEASDYNDYTEDEWVFVRDWIDRKLGI